MTLPNIGDLMEADFTFKVSSVYQDSNGWAMDGFIELNEKGDKRYISGVPLVCAKLFDPVKDSERTLAYQDVEQEPDYADPNW